MEARLLSWWQRVRKPLELFVILVGCTLVITLLVVIVLVYVFNADVPGLRGKTLWDWLQLLIIPAVLAVGGYLFNFTMSRNERQANEQRLQTERETAAKRDQTERDIALDNQREEALQSFIDKMSELLLEKQLRGSKGEDEARTIARVRTLAVLPRLDGNRKRAVLQFLHESGLIDKSRRIIELNGADLTGTELTGSDLKGADLSETDLSGIQQNGELSLNALNTANLSSAKLNGARLHKAHMIGVKLLFTYLEEADLSEANLILADLLVGQLAMG